MHTCVHTVTRFLFPLTPSGECIDHFRIIISTLLMVTSMHTGWHVFDHSFGIRPLIYQEANVSYLKNWNGCNVLNYYGIFISFPHPLK